MDSGRRFPLVQFHAGLTENRILTRRLPDCLKAGRICPESGRPPVGYNQNLAKDLKAADVPYQSWAKALADERATG